MIFVLDFSSNFSKEIWMRDHRYRCLINYAWLVRVLQLYSKLKATQREIEELQEEHVRERQELEQTQNELTRELKLKLQIIENFIPPEEKLKIISRAEYDEDEDTWKLKPLTKEGCVLQETLKPFSFFN